MIHPTAIIDPSAVIGENCTVGPFSIIEDGVTLEAGCRIDAHVILKAGTLLEGNVVVHPGAVIGGPPQDLGFDLKIRSGVRVGSETVIRELVTINRSSREGEATQIGEKCFLMAGSHVAHDCVLGERVILANLVMLAGHVNVGAFSFLGGSAGVHQFCRIGESVMVGGNASISMDLPPFTIVSERNRMSGLNLIGLRRRGFGVEVIGDIKRCFTKTYELDPNPRTAAEAAIRLGVPTTAEGRQFLKFFAEGKRGFARPKRGGKNED